MIKAEDIKPGKSYACKFKVETMLDQFGRPPNLSDVFDCPRSCLNKYIV